MFKSILKGLAFLGSSWLTVGILQNNDFIFWGSILIGVGVTLGWREEE